MRPLASLGRDEARGLVGLFFDLDDTLLTHGLLTRAAYDALWSLHDAHIRLVAVTGRPSGWGEVLARQWPIDGVVTENGAVTIVRAGRGVDVDLSGAGERERLDALVREVARQVPEARLSDDAHARRSDVTWDVGERATLDAGAIARVVALARAAGARTTQSSVHLHATFARDDKASGAVRFAAARFGDDPGAALARWAFAGDSGNDAACFAAFRTTFGVANVRAYARTLTIPPRYVATQERGAGFAEIAAALLSRR